jgi:molybdopterin converting factor small subunit
VEVSVRVFGALRERAGARQVAMTLPDGACVQDALDALADVASELPLVLAVNREYARPDTILRPRDELAAILPLSPWAPSSSTSCAQQRSSIGWESCP